MYVDTMYVDELEDLLLLKQEEQNKMRGFKPYFGPIKTIHSYQGLDIYKLKEYIIYVNDEKEIKFITYRPRWNQGLGIRCFIGVEELLWQLSYTYGLSYSRMTGLNKCAKCNVGYSDMGLTPNITEVYNTFTKSNKIAYRRKVLCN